MDGFQSLYGDGERCQWSETELNEVVFQSLLERQLASDWQYGATPRFTLELGGLRLEVVKGMVVRTEGQDSELQGKPFKDAALSLIHQIDSGDFEA